MVEPTIVSYNVKGLGEASQRKRRTIFNLLNNCKYDIILLQETHSTPKNEKFWSAEWGGKILFSHGDSNSKGVAILIRKNANITVIDHKKDNEGRVLSALVDVQGLKITLTVLYAPNEDTVQFYINAFNIAVSLENDLQIYGGDLNTVLDIVRDIKGGRGHSNVKTREFLNVFMEENDLVDIWRLQHPNLFDYTFKRSNPVFLQERLDYFLVSSALQQRVTDSFIKEMALSDHSLIGIKVLCTNHRPGKGYWKLNNSLLNDDTLVEQIDAVIKNIFHTHSKSDIVRAWEMMKMKVRETIIYRSKQIARSKDLKIKALEKKLDTVTKDYAKVSVNSAQSIFNDHEKQIMLIKTDLRELYEYRVNGAITRCRSNWLELGEKPTSYFLSLEKHNYNKKTITRIRNPKTQNITTDPKEILSILNDFYSNLYADKQLVLDLDYLGTVQFPQVEDKDKTMLDTPIAFLEVENAMNQLKLAKCPGTDGLTPEFYRKFWYLLGKPLHLLIQTNIRNAKLHSTARDGVISLLDKPDKDHLDILNWRPLSLLNTDYKIYAKVLANRLDKVLPYLIGQEQTGFMKGRSIADNLLDLFSIIHHCEINQIPALIMSMDIFKAFDSLQHQSIKQILLAFNFGLPFINMVMMCYNDTRAAVMNNNTWSEWIPIKGGVKQGCNLSPKIFLLAISVISLKMQQNEDIKGIVIKNREKKLAQCADDIWHIIPFEQDSFNTLVYEYSEFEDFTGLKINYDKTEILRIGSLNKTNARFITTLPLKWSDGPTRILGIKVFSTYKELLSNNYNDILNQASGIFKVWTNRILSPIGKIQVANFLASSKFVYKLQVLPTPDKKFFDTYRKMVTKFIWNNAPAKIPYKRLIAPKTEGGLQLRDLQMMDTSLKIAKFEKVKQDNPPFWALVYSNILTEDLNMIPNLNMSQKDIHKNLPPSYFTDVLKCWSLFNYTQPTTNDDILQQILWFNSNIRSNKNWLVNKILHKNGINKIADLFDFDTGEFETYENFKRYNPEISINFIEYYKIINSIPLSWKNTLKRNDPNNQHPQDHKSWHQKFFNSKIKKSQYVYKELMLNYACKNDALVTIWNNDLRINLDVKEFTSCFHRLYKTTKCTKLLYFQFRILCKALTTNVRVAKWDTNTSDLCTHCKNAKETVIHLFIECPNAQKLWKAFYKWILYFHKLKILLSPAEIMLGTYKGKLASLVNSMVLIAKFYIYRSKVQKTIMKFVDFITEVNKYKLLEERIATKNDKLYKYARKWNDFTCFP